MKLTQIILFLLLPIFTYSQKNNEFEQTYNEGERCLNFSYDSCSQCIQNLKELPSNSELQKIRIDLLESKANCQVLSIDSSKNILKVKL